MERIVYRNDERRGLPFSQNMDNLTHTLIGYAVGRATPESVRGPQRKESAVIWTSIVASNLPDLDFLVAFFMEDRQLGYVLHHRGHTHTLAFVPIAAALSAALVAKLTGLRLERRDAAHLFAVGLAAGLLHIAFDALNNYGVHPYFPVDQRWRYGDSIFIVEPLFFFSLLPFIAMRARQHWARWAAIATGAAVLALVWFLPSLSRPAALFGTAWLFGASLVEWRLGRGRGTRPALAPLAGVLAAIMLFVTSGRAARAIVRQEAVTRSGTEELVDAVTTPAPGDPMCWSVLAVSRTRADDLVVRRGAVALLPAVVPAHECRFGQDAGTAPLSPSPEPRSPTLSYDREFRAPLRELREQHRDSCRARALLRFVRVPFWRPWEGGATLLGDLRYDRAPKPEFAELPVGPGDDARCPRFVPGWVSPRDDLLADDRPTR